MKFNLYASQYSKHLSCLMKSISQLSVILHCLCYVILISYLALHCPNSPIIIPIVYPKNCSNLRSLPLGWERLYSTPLASSPPPRQLGGEGEGEKHVLQGGMAGIFLKRTPTVSKFKFPVLNFRTPAGSSQPGVGGVGTINGHWSLQGVGGT